MRERPLVLVVDDEDDFLEIASARLAAAGFAIVATRDSREALAKAREIQPDLVLSDIYMPPGQGGWELALSLQRDEKTAGLKFALFTSSRDPYGELGTDRDAVIDALRDVRIFSKTNDMESLGEQVLALINN